MEIPVNLINLAKKVETNAAIQDESDSNMFNIFVIISRYHLKNQKTVQKKQRKPNKLIKIINL